MSSLPPEVLRVVEAVEGTWTNHAAISRDELGLQWTDVFEIARTGVGWKRQRDEKKADRGRRRGYIDSVVGRDTSGRLLYMAGKVKSYREERFWHVITIHLPG